MNQKAWRWAGLGTLGMAAMFGLSAGSPARAERPSASVKGKIRPGVEANADKSYAKIVELGKFINARQAEGFSGEELARSVGNEFARLGVTNEDLKAASSREDKSNPANSRARARAQRLEAFMKAQASQGASASQLAESARQESRRLRLADDDATSFEKGRNRRGSDQAPAEAAATPEPTPLAALPEPQDFVITIAGGNDAPEITVAPLPEVVATPIPEATATPLPEATATPVPQATATPAPEVTATPVPEATPPPSAPAAPAAPIAIVQFGQSAGGDTSIVTQDFGIFFAPQGPNEFPPVVVTHISSGLSGLLPQNF